MYALENEFDCRCFGDGDAFFSVVNNETPDLVLLDIMLPGDDGFEILKRLKKGNTAHIPVIMVSAKGEEISKVRGLNAGADDYISKPFGVLELVARIKANLRKRGVAATEKIVYRDIKIDCLKRRVTVNGAEIQTTLKEYELFVMFCHNAETVQTREAIFNAVWGESFMGESRTLDIHVSELRKKLSEAGGAAVIQTVRGVGYMLI